MFNFLNFKKINLICIFFNYEILIEKLNYYFENVIKKVNNNYKIILEILFYII